MYFCELVAQQWTQHYKGSLSFSLLRLCLNDEAVQLSFRNVFLSSCHRKHKLIGIQKEDLFSPFKIVWVEKFTMLSSFS